MKIQLLSDLHHEYHTDEVPPIAESAADVVILAGDIDVGTAGISWAVAESERLAKPLIYVAGNHEYYHGDIAALDELRAAAAGSDAVHFLERDAVVIDGVRFLGCTLWTNFGAGGDPGAAMARARDFMSDHVLIRNGRKPFLPQDALEIHRRSRAWLEERLAQPHEGPTVVVTHHGAHPVCQHPGHPVTSITGAFWSDLPDLVAQADMWCFGHTHANPDERVGRCRIVANQRGYPGELVPGYRADRVFALE